jgi:hypothetical protein
MFVVHFIPPPEVVFVLALDNSIVTATRIVRLIS